MATPEGAVKTAVKKALMAEGLVPFSDIVNGKAREYEGFFFMPVAGPFAVHGVHDFIGCWNGIFFSLETKAPNEPSDATPHQAKFHEAVGVAGGVSFVGVRDVSVIDELKRRVLDKESSYAKE
jgi:hypothetical protein